MFGQTTIAQWETLLKDVAETEKYLKSLDLGEDDDDDEDDSDDSEDADNQDPVPGEPAADGPGADGFVNNGLDVDDFMRDDDDMDSGELGEYESDS